MLRIAKQGQNTRPHLTPPQGRYATATPAILLPSRSLDARFLASGTIYYYYYYIFFLSLWHCVALTSPPAAFLGGGVVLGCGRPLSGQSTAAGQPTTSPSRPTPSRCSCRDPTGTFRTRGHSVRSRMHGSCLPHPHRDHPHSELVYAT